MTVIELLAQLNRINIALSVKGSDLAVHGKKDVLAPALVNLLRQHKDELFELIKSGQYVGPRETVVVVPPNEIPAGCDDITPDMLPLVELTVDEVAAVVDRVSGGAANVQDIYPLAPLQEGLLFHHLMNSGADPYLLHGLYRFASRALLDKFVQAAQAVVDRHDILRTAILWEGLREPVQVVQRRASLVVEEVALDTLPIDTVEQLREKFNARGFRMDVRQAPLMRICFAHEPATDQWTVLHLFHHLVVDHTTMDILRHEVEMIMAGQSHLLPPPLPFRNFIAQARLGVSRQEHEAFFQTMLRDVNEPTIPFGIATVDGDGSGIDESRHDLAPELVKRLQMSTRALDVSMASVCHLAWAQVLSRISGCDNVVFGTVLAGRLQGGEGADRVLGMFINTLPIKIQIGEESVKASVQRTHLLLAELLRHEHAPLSLAQGCSGIAAPTPLLTAILNYRFNANVGHDPEGAMEDAPPIGNGIEFLGSEERTNYPLCLNIDDSGAGLTLNVQAQSPIDHRRVCGYMESALERLADALEHAPNARLRSLDILPQVELRQLLLEWNSTEVDNSHDQCIHRLFEAQAGKTPEVVAVVLEDRQLSYGELNAQANRLACYLRKLGVVPDACVAICMERSLDMVVGLLAVLKAGGAYVPLDPDYPADRLSYML
ncbi:condensation domain-containing protein, partial [Noviherbaspirillum sp.]|uniref:condensation domain-containing protein n=1 Tax=Noviherbaspirillum sp. TaxID=1926288 RepID=UPI002FE32683